MSPIVNAGNRIDTAENRARLRCCEASPQLSAERWPEYFAQLARGEEGVLVTVEVLGGRERIERAPQRPRDLRAIGYCPRRDVLELAVDGHEAGVPGLRYFISAPRQIHLEQADGRTEILVRDASGARTLIRLLNVPRSLAGSPGERR